MVINASASRPNRGVKKSEDKLRLLVTKYTILTMVAILSTFTAALLTSVIKSGIFLTVDMVVKLPSLFLCFLFFVFVLWGLRENDA